MRRQREENTRLWDGEALNARDALRELPAVLETVAAERRNYEKALHESRLTEGPVIILAQGTALHSARAGAEAFEWLLGWPSLARETTEFLQYSAALLRPRATIIVVSRSGECEDAVEIARRAARSGANLLALTANAGSPLAQAARAQFTLPTIESEQWSAAGPIAELLSLFEIATAAAGILNPRNPQLEAVASGLEKLPEKVLWMQTQLRDPIRLCASQLSRSAHFIIVGGNFYRHAAAHAAAFGRRVSKRIIEAMEAGDVFPASSGVSDAFLLLSGSRSRDKNTLHKLAQSLKASEAKLISLTDANDQALVHLSDLALLMPELPPMPGSLLTLSLLNWLLLECSSSSGSTPERGELAER